MGVGWNLEVIQRIVICLTSSYKEGQPSSHRLPFGVELVPNPNSKNINQDIE